MTQRGSCAAQVKRLVLPALAIVCIAGLGGIIDQHDNSRGRPPARSGLMACAVDGMIYLTGGSSAGRDDSPRLDAWNSSTGVWTRLPPPKHERALGAMVNINERVYLIGGLGKDNKAASEIEVFNTNSRTWEQPITDPAPASRHAAVAIGNVIYIIGGINESTVHSPHVRALNTATKEWSSHADLALGRHGHAAAVRNGRIYVTGGYAIENSDGSNQSTSVEVFDPAVHEWKRGPSLAKPHAFHGMASLNGSLLVFGTRGDDRTLEILHPDSQQWVAGTPMPAPRHRLACAVVGSRLYVFHGEDERGDTEPTIMIYDANTKLWRLDQHDPPATSDSDED